MLSCEFENGNKTSLRHVVTDNIVLRDDEILLIKRADKFLEGGKWGLIGGFIERDETIQEGAAREIMEETGYTVTDITLLRVIDTPHRPAEDRQNVSFVHFCTAKEKTGEANQESTDQQWFPLEALPNREDFAFDQYDSVLLYLKYTKQTFLIPVIG